MTAGTAPIIETERLRLRPQSLQDFAFFEAMWADSLVTKFVGGARAREEVWTKFLRNAGFWALLGYGFWAVEEKGGELLGEVGLGEFKRNVVPLVEGNPEAGWVFDVNAQGKGFATEAVSAVLAWADDNLIAPQTTCIIDQGHKDSIRVAEKCGFVRKSDGQYHGEEVVIMARTRRTNV